MKVRVHSLREHKQAGDAAALALLAALNQLGPLALKCIALAQRTVRELEPLAARVIAAERTLGKDCSDVQVFTADAAALLDELDGQRESVEQLQAQVADVIDRARKGVAR